MGDVPGPKTRTPVGPVVAARGISRHFADFTALDDVTIDVEKGTILGVIGPSGSGKTTLIRILTGTLEPTHGDVRVLGEIPKRFGRRTREQIGYMPQLFLLYPDLTVAENVSFVAALFGLMWRTRKRRVREVLEFVELWDARSRRAKDLSGGMQRRLELACALVHEPRLLFMDEPTAGLDPVLRQKFWEEFRRLREAGRTLIVTTQYVGEAEHCDIVAVIAEGRLIALDEPEKLRKAALGGDVLEVETTFPVDATALRQMDLVTEVRQPGPRLLRIVVEDAAAATPRIVEALNLQNVEVARTAVYHPTFDEVFAELIERGRRTAAEADKQRQVLEAERQYARAA